MSARARIVCFGELLVRLSGADGEQLLQSPSLRVHFGGAEANVAVSLARFGHDAAMVSIVPANVLGAAPSLLALGAVFLVGGLGILGFARRRRSA